ncbi:hypothetical protein [Paenibacillus amylolyticus]|uniref:mediterrocin family bacteriocin n=1 Tax=Paenibacillus amylolyticus TaxID=1451 RepID=UPI0039B0E0CD
MNIKKLLATAGLTIAMLSVASSALASPVTTSKNSSGQGFTKSWELVASGPSWIMEYGFNKFAIDEDYVHTKHSGVSHTALLSNGSNYSNSANAGNWAEVDVSHQGTYVTYSIVYTP